MSEELQIIEANITREYNNIAKNIKRPRSRENITQKSENLTKLLKEYKTILLNAQNSIALDLWDTEYKKYQTLKSITIESLKLLSNSITLKPKFKTVARAAIIAKRLSSKGEVKMPAVDIKLGTSLIQIYDGSPDHLNSFLDAVALFSDIVNGEFATATADQKTTADVTVFKFIKTRLTGVARQSIIGAQNLKETLDKLKIQCASKISSDNIKAKMIALKKRGTVEEFCKEVENLTQQLAATYINETIPADKANQMATKSGIESLINGIDHTDSKLILRAGTFTKINEAIQKLQENYSEEKQKSSMAQMFYANNNHYQRGRGRGGFNSNRRNFPSDHRSFSRNHDQQRFQNPRNNFRGQNSRGQWNRGRGRYETRSTYFIQPQAIQPALQQLPPVGYQQIQQQPQPAYQQQQPPAQNNTFLGTQFGRHSQ